MKTSLLILLSAGALLGSSSLASAQTSAVYTSGSATDYSLSLGQTYSFNLGYVHSYVGFNVRPGSSGTWTLGTDGANNGGAMILGGLNGALAFVTVPTSGTAVQTYTEADLRNMSRMALSPTGSLRIGGTAPTGMHSDYKLSVDGKLVAKSVYVTPPTAWADFVFEPTYQLLSLPTLEQYLQANKHLPNIPSAKEVEANGYNLGNMDVKLLQSLEELTLHVIQLGKQNEQLRSRVAELEQRMAAAKN